MEKLKIEKREVVDFLPKKGRDINSLTAEGVKSISDFREGVGLAPKDKIHEFFPEIELITNTVRKIKCKHYHYPYSNCTIYALGDEKGDLNFNIRSQSALFSKLFEEYDEIDYEEIQPGDIAVYYDKKRDINAPEGDIEYLHIGKITNDLQVESQWGNIGVYKHAVPLIQDKYGDSVTFMRKKK